VGSVCEEGVSVDKDLREEPTDTPGKVKAEPSSGPQES